MNHPQLLMRLGFETQTVHRVFVLHPLLRPFSDQLTLRSTNTMMRLIPGNRSLSKGSGIVGSMLGKT